MANLVLDEWFWADLSGNNSPADQKEAFEFITVIFKKCDRIVRVKGSKFETKTFEFWKHSSDVMRRRMTRYYRDHFWSNPDKSLLLEESSLPPIPADIAKGIKEDDHYLVRAYLSAEADVIVTTDKPLIDALLKTNICCEHRKQYLSNYIKKYGQASNNAPS